MLVLADYVKQQGPVIDAMGMGRVRLRTPVPQHEVVLWVDLTAEDVRQVKEHGSFRAELMLLDEDAEPVSAPNGGETRAEVNFSPRGDRAESDEPSFDEEHGIALPVHLTVPAETPLPAGIYCWRARVELNETFDEVFRYFQVEDGQPVDPEPQGQASGAA